MKRNQKPNTSVCWTCFPKTESLIRMVMDDNPVEKDHWEDPDRCEKFFLRKDVEDTGWKI